jgi:uncharacterized membrane protein YecN with MAPEG domain
MRVNGLAAAATAVAVVTAPLYLPDFVLVVILGTILVFGAVLTAWTLYHYLDRHLR